MGFLDDFGIKSDDVTAPIYERKLPAAGHHLFEIGDAAVRKGTKNKPQDIMFLIEYQLSDADGDPTGSSSEWFTMKQNGEVTEYCSQQLGYLDLRAKNLGFKDGLNDPEFSAENIIGIRGKLEIVHNKGKGANSDRTYANVKNVTEFEDDEEPVKAETVVSSATADVAELFG